LGGLGLTKELVYWQTIIPISLLGQGNKILKWGPFFPWLVGKGNIIGELFLNS